MIYTNPIGNFQIQGHLTDNKVIHFVEACLTGFELTHDAKRAK